MDKNLQKTFLVHGGCDFNISNNEADQLFTGVLNKVFDETSVWLRSGSLSKVLLLPPDITRYYSKAGLLACIAYRELTARGISVKVMPALGTHVALTDDELEKMFPLIPKENFIVHDWRNDVIELGRIEKEFIEKISEGAVSYDWPVQVNKIFHDGNFSLIISLGQVVPHEVAGLANHTKNLLVGAGGKECIDKSHFTGAVFGMERIMGRVDTPVRAMFDEGIKRFGGELPPVLYALTVIGPYKDNPAALKGIFAGFGRECFEQAALLSRDVNVNLLDEPVKKAVVFLDPAEYRTTWIGNKAVYRLRMAMADGGEILIIAPGIERFGEDKDIDALIRRFGYRTSSVIRNLTKTNADLSLNLGAAAHLIHGSSEGRFTVRYFPGKNMSRGEIQSVGYEWGDINKAFFRYKVNELKAGWNVHADGEKFFFVPNPALGLWSVKDRWL